MFSRDQNVDYKGEESGLGNSGKKTRQDKGTTPEDLGNGLRRGRAQHEPTKNQKEIGQFKKKLTPSQAQGNIIKA